MEREGSSPVRFGNNVNAIVLINLDAVVVLTCCNNMLQVQMLAPHLWFQICSLMPSNPGQKRGIKNYIMWKEKKKGGGRGKREKSNVEFKRHIRGFIVSLVFFFYSVCGTSYFLPFS